MSKNLNEIQNLAGTDAAVFLYFLHMARWCLTAIAVVVCIILVPVDLTYNIAHQNDSGPHATQTDGQKTRSNGQKENYLLYLTMSHVDGSRLWAHVVLSYVATLIALSLIYFYYRKVIAFRQEFFTSAQYQRSYYSRALMITDIPTQYQSDRGLLEALSSVKIQYPFSEVQIGHEMHDLPYLLKHQKNLVLKLEKCLDQTLRRHRETRPHVRLGGKLGNMFGGTKVDALEYYSEQLKLTEQQIHAARSDSTDKNPMSYGFASLAAVPYAHTVGKAMSKDRPLGMRIRLASSPRDIIWENLVKSPEERARSKTIGVVYFTLLFFANLFPLLLVALISNMNVFSVHGNFLEVWQRKSFFSFAAVEGILPPLISMSSALLLPILMHRISMYRGVRTRESRNQALCGQYFSFMILTHFLFFSLISVFLDIAVFLVDTVQHHDNANKILSGLWRLVLERIAIRFQSVSGYWMTWIILKGYMQLFELAQITRIIFVWLHKHIARRTPRELYEFSRPPSFQYWVYYAELMFLASIGMIYAPLAPLIPAFAAAVFWMASFVYKYQFIYVYKTKSETGGRLWNIMVNRLLVTIASMQIIVAIVIGIYQSWIKAVACVPPVLFVIAFRLFCHLKLEPRLLWYTPSPMDLAMSKVHVHDADRQRLARQFGHPLLHERLFCPIVHPDMMNRAKQIYSGPLESGKVFQDYDMEKGSDENPIGMQLFHYTHEDWRSSQATQGEDCESGSLVPIRETLAGRKYESVPLEADDERDLYRPKTTFAHTTNQTQHSAEGWTNPNVPPMRQDTYPLPDCVRGSQEQSLVMSSNLPKSSSTSIFGLDPSQMRLSEQHPMLSEHLFEEPEELIFPTKTVGLSQEPSESVTDLASYYLNNNSRESSLNLQDTPYNDPADQNQARIYLPPAYTTNKL